MFIQTEFSPQAADYLLPTFILFISEVLGILIIKQQCFPFINLEKYWDALEALYNRVVIVYKLLTSMLHLWEVVRKKKKTDLDKLSSLFTLGLQPFTQNG